MTIKFLSENNYTTHNDTDTYYIKQRPVSCIDHIYSNCPQKITNVKTHNTGQSDHSILMAIYHTKAPIAPKRQFFSRKTHKLTSHSLNQHLQHNHVLNSAFTFTDPNLIADIIMSEYNNIIEIISPRTIRQIRRNYTPYLTKKLIKKKQYLYRLHIRAKHTKDNTDWTEYKNLKATLNKEINNNKTNYINKRQ